MPSGRPLLYLPLLAEFDIDIEISKQTCLAWFFKQMDHFATLNAAQSTAKHCFVSSTERVNNDSLFQSYIYQGSGSWLYTSLRLLKV